MTLFVIRHGQTDWNAEKRLQGQHDIPLNDVGRRQAADNGARLASLGLSLAGFDFVSSPLSRARETMEILRRSAGLPPQDYRLEDRLIEICFGDWEGCTLKEVARVSPDSVKRRKLEKWDFVPPGEFAESYEILSWRVGSWLKEIDRPTVAVCHGGVIRCIFKLVGGMSRQQAADIPIPQEKVLHISGTRVEWI